MSVELSLSPFNQLIQVENTSKEYTVTVTANDTLFFTYKVMGKLVDGNIVVNSIENTKVTGWLEYNTVSTGIVELEAPRDMSFIDSKIDGLFSSQGLTRSFYDSMEVTQDIYEERVRDDSTPFFYRTIVKQANFHTNIANYRIIIKIFSGDNIGTVTSLELFFYGLSTDINKNFNGVGYWNDNLTVSNFTVTSKDESNQDIDIAVSDISSILSYCDHYPISEIDGITSTGAKVTEAKLLISGTFQRDYICNNGTAVIVGNPYVGDPPQNQAALIDIDGNILIGCEDSLNQGLVRQVRSSYIGKVDMSDALTPL